MQSKALRVSYSPDVGGKKTVHEVRFWHEWSVTSCWREGEQTVYDRGGKSQLWSNLHASWSGSCTGPWWMEDRSQSPSRQCAQCALCLSLAVWTCFNHLTVFILIIEFTKVMTTGPLFSIIIHYIQLHYIWTTFVCNCFFFSLRHLFLSFLMLFIDYLQEDF